jgi:hypothetical protein
MATNKGGRPPVVIDVTQIEKLAARWMTKDAIADFLGIARSTLYDKMRTDPEIETAWYRGRATLQAKSMDWLIASAQNGSVRAQIFLAERICGLKEALTIEGEVNTRYVVEIPPEEPQDQWQASYGAAEPQDGA